MKLKARITVEAMERTLGREASSQDMAQLAREVSALHSRRHSSAERELDALLRRVRQKP